MNIVNNILITNSDISMLNKFWKDLKGSNLTIYTAVNKKECIKIITENLISVVLVDFAFCRSVIDVIKVMMVISPDTLILLSASDKERNIAYNSLEESHTFKFISKPLRLNEVNNLFPQMFDPKKYKVCDGDTVSKKRHNLECSFEKINSVGKLGSQSIIFSLAKLIESNEPKAESHLMMVKIFVRILSKRLTIIDKYSEYIDDNYVDSIVRSSVLHDIGKVYIPDSILLKPHKLTESEFEIVKQHPLVGGDAIDEAETMTGEYLQFISLAKLMAYYHHERWDGTGYPQRLKGNNIPLCARILALCDVYDVLISDRPYRSAYSCKEASRIIFEERGRYFDPEIVSEFMKIKDSFKTVSESIRG